MEKSRVLTKPTARKELEAIPTKKDRQRIVRRIQSLADDPRRPGWQILAGYDRFRVRQGQYVFVYEIRNDELIVVVVKVGNRRDVYRKL